MNHDHITLIIKRVMLAGIMALIMPIFIYQATVLNLSKPAGVEQILQKSTKSDDERTLIRAWRTTQEYTIGSVLLICGITLIAAGVFITASGLSLGFLLSGITTSLAGLFSINSSLEYAYLISILFAMILIFVAALAWHDRT